ncbi:hypothetical protein HDV03_004196 [Kappamyces sp. JEL0829]|nr:hypothetical protein HDV03_004196 [Kappamyces sp. JEL0829]
MELKRKKALLASSYSLPIKPAKQSVDCIEISDEDVEVIRHSRNEMAGPVELLAAPLKEEPIIISSDSDDHPATMAPGQRTTGMGAGAAPETRPMPKDRGDSPYGDVQILKTVVSPTVCLGLIEAAIVDVNHGLIPPSSKHLSVLKAQISLCKLPGRYFYGIQFYLEKGFPMANLDENLCSILYPILTLLRFDARIIISGPRSPYCKLILYAKLSDAANIGQHLQLCRVLLLHPDELPKEQYMNPQLVNQASPALPIPLVDKKDPVDRKIIELYKSFTSPEDLAEMDQDARLLSSLFKYQRQGLHWMWTQEQNTRDRLPFWKKEGGGIWRNILTSTVVTTRPRVTRGGILADDMGLGKTIQVISLILKNPPLQPTDPDDLTLDYTQSIPTTTSPKPDIFGFVPAKEKPQIEKGNPSVGTVASKATLIICPLSTIHNWEDQILTHTVANSLKVLVYHGTSRTNNPHLLRDYDIVVTTYNIITQGFNANDGCTPLHEVYWYRVVLDEAHIIKSQSNLQSRAAHAFRADIRWCLTGTPIQNKLDDLYSIVRFLKVPIIEKKAEWQHHITKPILQGKNMSAYSRLQILMKSLTLRRTKDDMIDGKPILSLPPRHDEVRVLDLDADERELYDKVHQKGKAYFESQKAAGTVMKNYVTVLRAILLMRQACLHSSLVRLEDVPLEGSDDGDGSKPLTLERAKSLYSLLQQAGEDVCVFCNNPIQDPCPWIAPCKHLVCIDCVESQFQKSTKKSVKQDCPICAVTINSSSLIEIPEIEPEVGVPAAVTLGGFGMGTKLEALVADLLLLRARDIASATVTKSIVFSQFTSMLDLCEKPLRKAGFAFVRLDGKMSRANRSIAQKEFKDNPTITIFLVSIQAGGVGLNLVSASRVYLLEPYWNPAVEKQAVDRVHRLGQTKAVTTVRFIIRDSIEENMRKRQEHKLAYAEKAMDEDQLEDGGASSSDASGRIIQRKRKKKDGPEGNSRLAIEKLESLSILFR